MQTVQIRALPASNRPRYWSAQLPWTKDPIKVEIVDLPRSEIVKMITDATPNPGKVNAEMLAELRRDDRIVVDFGENSGDTAAVNEAKARTARLEEELKDARRELAAFAEQVNRDAELKRLADEEAQKVAERIAIKDAEIESLRAQLAAGKKR